MRPHPQRDQGLGSLVKNKTILGNGQRSDLEGGCFAYFGASASTVKGNDEQGPKPAKRARLEPVINIVRCRGNCPAVWTIYQYCPNCHG